MSRLPRITDKQTFDAPVGHITYYNNELKTKDTKRVITIKIILKNK